MSCPDCHSTNAVPKAEAWDALASVPPKVADRLAHLERVSAAGQALLDSAGEPRGEEVCVAVTFPKKAFDAFKRELLFGE